MNEDLPALVVETRDPMLILSVASWLWLFHNSIKSYEMLCRVTEYYLNHVPHAIRMAESLILVLMQLNSSLIKIQNFSEITLLHVINLNLPFCM